MTAPACVMCGKYGGAGPLLIAGLFATVVAIGVGRSLRWDASDTDTG